MRLRSQIIFLILILSGLAFAPTAEATVDRGGPTIRSVQGRSVLLVVPPGYTSVTLQQREGGNGKTWKILATRTTRVEGGLYRILVRRPLSRRGLFVFGTPVDPAGNPSRGPLTTFLADPSLDSTQGFTGAGGSTPGVVALNRASTDAVAATNGASSAAREVVESDIWRVDGDRLYFFNQLRGLQVFDIEDPDAPVLLGQLREPNRGEQMYLLGPDHIALLTRASYFFSLANRPFVLAKDSSTTYDAASGAIVIADVSGGKPGELARVSYPGFLVESRLVGTSLYLVSQVYGTDGRNRLVVSSYDLGNPDEPRRTDLLELEGYGRVIAATDRYLFVVKASSDWRRSIIEVIDISSPDGRLTRRGQVTLAGQVPDKFKINLKGDILTVVSEVPRNWAGDWNAPENLPRTMVESFSLADPDSPETLGSLELGVGERLHATRFSGDRLYVVTFLTIDPLYVVDLSDPGHPTLLGELEVPGFSTYIQPLGDRLVSIGRLDSRTAVSLFDVSDPGAPSLISQLPLGDGYNHSEANWDEKAFGVFPEDGLILVPYSGYDSATGWASRIQLIDLHHDGLAKRGIVDQGFAARRTAIVDDRILAISPSDLITVDFSDRDRPVVTSDVEIAWRVDRVFLSGDYLVEIGGSADWSRASPPTITIADADDPDATLNLIELENVPVTGATVRNGRLYLAQQESNAWLPVYRPAGGSEPPVSNSPLILSVYDLSALPAITRIGRTEADVDPGYGYGAGQLEAAWPDDETLVWVRERWSSWWWYDYLPMPMVSSTARVLVAEDATSPVSTLPSVTLGSAGGVALKNANLEVGEGGPAGSTAGDRPTTADAAPALVAGSIRLLPPWHRTSVGHEMVAFDVSDPGAPRFATKVDVRIGNTGDWSAPLAVGGKLYLSAMAFDGWTDPSEGRLSRRYRHFLRTVDFSEVDRPVLGDEVSIPGRLLAVTDGGTTLLTVGCGFDPDGRPISRRAFHTSRFDGASATLIDQLRASSSSGPHALDGNTLLTGTLPSQKGKSGAIEAWRIGGDRRFSLADRIEAPAYASLGALNGLLVGFGNGLPEVYDVSDPANLRFLDRADTRELTQGDLGRADGGAGRGLWQAQGNSGVGVVRLPR
jgi:hypothetical protein